jgi:hypothetical protein
MLSGAKLAVLAGENVLGLPQVSLAVQPAVPAAGAEGVVLFLVDGSNSAAGYKLRFGGPDLERLEVHLDGRAVDGGGAVAVSAGPSANARVRRLAVAPAESGPRPPATLVVTIESN